MDLKEQNELIATLMELSDLQNKHNELYRDYLFIKGRDEINRLSSRQVVEEFREFVKENSNGRN